VRSNLNKIRKPAVAGQFYEGDKTSLKEDIKNCFLDSRGPQELSEITDGKNNLKGLIVPHAGYMYSGAIAAYSYNYLSKHGFADTFIILGPNHTGYGGAWETPLGSVSINSTLAKQICRDIIDDDENAHIHEHSIEVQLPFLQYIGGNNFDFIPICMGMQDYDTAFEVGNIISEAIKKTDTKVVVIASTDFSHAGFNYMTMPPEGMRVDEYANKQDQLAINQILNMNPQALVETVQKNNITMCGYGPVAALLTSAKNLGATKVELLKYGTSYEVAPSSSCVGYGALAVI